MAEKENPVPTSKIVSKGIDLDLEKLPGWKYFKKWNFIFWSIAVTKKVFQKQKS